MPRNSSGVYSLPVSAFVSGTAIIAADMNSNLSDIASALTGSLALNGVSTMTGQVVGYAGAAATPSYTFSGATDSGFYLSGTDEMSYSANGTQAIKFNADGTVTFNYSIKIGGVAPPLGQCRLAVSGADLVLSPYNGNAININNQLYIIPSGGVTLTSSGAANSTWYYIYAYISGSAIALERSTTGRATNTTTGMQQKSGDATRTLVGAVYTTGSGGFVDTSGQRQTISWFNRQPKFGWTNFSVNRTGGGGGSLVFSEVNSELRNFFICWSDDTPTVFHHALLTFNNAETNIYSAVAVDSAVTNLVGGHITYPSGLTGTMTAPLDFSYMLTGLSESPGAHYVTMLGAVDVGTATWNAGATNIGGSRIGVLISG